MLWKVGHLAAICPQGRIGIVAKRIPDAAQYTLLDANLGYEWNHWEFNLFGLNLTDEEYYTSLVNNLPGTPGVAGSPRVIGLSVSKEF